MAKQLNDHEIQMAELKFRKYLHDCGLKYTPERKTLLHQVLNNDGHFDAEQLLITMRRDGKRVAKATIYRTLPLLVNCGIIKQVQFGDKLAHYEHSFAQEAHDHMICQRCQRIIEFDSTDVVRLRTFLAARHRFHAVSHRFQIMGLCWECAQACPPQQRPFIPEGDGD